MPTDSHLVLEARYSPSEVERLCKLQEYPDYARRFLTNPVFYGTRIDKAKGQSVLSGLRVPVLAVDWRLQTYRRGVVRDKDAEVLASGKYLVRKVKKPLWFDSVLSDEPSVEIVAFASEDYDFLLGCYVDADVLIGNELANHLCLALQCADDSLYDEYQKLFIEEAVKYVKNQLRRISLRRLHVSAEIDDLIQEAMLRVLTELSAFQQELCGSTSLHSKSSVVVKRFPEHYPLGPQIVSYQRRVEKYLTMVADTVSKQFVRKSKAAKGKPELGSKAKAAAAKKDFDWEEPELERRIREDKVFDIRKLNASEPIRAVFMKQGISEIKKILPKALLKKLYMRSEYGSSLKEIAIEHGVSKGAIFKDFETIEKRAGSVAVRYLSGVSVQEYSAMRHSRRRRRSHT